MRSKSNITPEQSKTPYSDLYWECFLLQHVDVPISYYEEFYPRTYDSIITAVKHAKRFRRRNPMTWRHGWLARRYRRMARDVMAEELIARFPESARLAGVA